ncbi:MAG: hypothetical protein U0P81_09675 [Holophagaceae bacterium]
MKPRTALLALLYTLLAAALPAVAQERFSAALSYDSQSPRSQSYDPITFSPAANRGFGLAFAWKARALGSADLDLTAALRFKAKSDLDVAGERAGKFASEHVALGAQVVWHPGVDLGLGLQVRFEKQALVPLEEGDTWSARQTRPWLTASLGHAFAGSGSVKPFVALVAALPLTSTGKPTGAAASDAEAQANQERLVKSLAPKFEIGLQVGLKF